MDTLYSWILSLVDDEDYAIGVNDKVIRGTKQDNGRQVNLLSAFLNDYGIVVDQCEVDDKTNEIPMVPPLLDPLNPQHQTIDKGHGRIEIRQIWTSTALNDYLDFPHIQQVICIRRKFHYVKSGKKTDEILYAIISLPENKANLARLLRLNRGRWGIKNRLHYVRDVTFGEDSSQIRTKHTPRIMATFRNLAISIFRYLKHMNIAKALRGIAAKPYNALSVIGL